jgi:hypothetical protein
MSLSTLFSLITVNDEGQWRLWAFDTLFPEAPRVTSRRRQLPKPHEQGAGLVLCAAEADIHSDIRPSRNIGKAFRLTSGRVKVRSFPLIFEFRKFKSQMKGTMRLIFDAVINRVRHRWAAVVSRVPVHRAVGKSRIGSDSGSQTNMTAALFSRGSSASDQF